MNTKQHPNLRHLITSETFTRAWLERVLDRAGQFVQDGFVHTLPNKIIATCFFEPSTRTRLSFNAAAYKLGANVLGFDSATSTSTAKGEALADTIRMVSHYADTIVLRHPEAGSAEQAAAVASVPVINAGDGANQHPTQTLVDLCAIQQGIGRLDDFTILMMGDIEHSRVVHSLAASLKLFNNVNQILINPLEQDYKPHLPDADIVLVTRVQQERHSDAAAAQRLKQAYCFSLEDALQLKPSAKIIAPLPRLSELPTTIDAQPQAYYFTQAGLAVPVRAALLEYVLQVW